MEQFSGSETIAAPIAKVWAYLMDVHKVAACVPGFQSLEELGDAEHTRMDWTAQVTVSGTIASVGARLLHQTAEKLTGQFFDCLRTKLQTAETAGAG